MMDLGAFSVSLAVKDVEASRLFYEKLGFTVFGGMPRRVGSSSRTVIT
jgi:lactoylglutathione lyase